MGTANLIVGTAHLAVGTGYLAVGTVHLVVIVSTCLAVVRSDEVAVITLGFQLEYFLIVLYLFTN